MKVVALQGLHGGTGTSGIVAALAAALVQTGQTVLCIDLDPRNLLRLYFNHQWRDRRGWAQAVAAGQDWHEGAFTLGAGLDFLPYGETEPRGRTAAFHDWRQRLAILEDSVYGWILLDIPQGGATEDVRHTADIHLRVAQADPICHALLAAGALGNDDCLLINRFLPSSTLQKDLHELWQAHYPDRLVPRVVHQDEAMFEALAHKRSVVAYRPQSLAAQDIQCLATWLLAREDLAE
ncbi:cellulose biosynthesis protein BcsQ [Pistricoccus aurantiacus]|uniref:cellulose biosynthesis protein BcsQ n=1 Tax=Pistricoccus aurantiacus TaxID=1883414 RepID=UPI00363450FA